VRGGTTMAKGQKEAAASLSRVNTL
jgi:hypothetical protein